MTQEEKEGWGLRRKGDFANYFSHPSPFNKIASLTFQYSNISGVSPLKFYIIIIILNMIFREFDFKL